MESITHVCWPSRQNMIPTISFMVTLLLAAKDGKLILAGGCVGLFNKERE